MKVLYAPLSFPASGRCAEAPCPRRERHLLFHEAVLCKQRGEEEIAEACRRGLPEPVLVPHPDQIIVDPIAGSVKVRGPLADEEKGESDRPSP